MDNIRLTKVVDHGYEAVVVRTADYYPFGMVMPGRNKEYVEGKYRFGYNGMEMDNEVSGNGNSYTTEFRQYDPRLGRWKSLDPLMYMFPSMSPYVAFDNNPIFYIDPFGLASTNGEGDPPPGMPECNTDENGAEVDWKDGDVYNSDITDISWYNAEGEWKQETYLPETSISPFPQSVQEAGPDGVDWQIAYTGIDKFGPQMPILAADASDWWKEVTQSNYQAELKVWNGLSLEEKWYKARKSTIIGQIREAGQEAMRPVAQLYTLHTILGGSGTAIGMSSSTVKQAIGQKALAYKVPQKVMGNYLIQSGQTGSINPMDHNMFGYVGSVITPSSMQGQMAVGAAGGLINYTPNRGLYGVWNRPLGVTTADMIIGGTAPVYTIGKSRIGIFFGVGHQIVGARALDYLEKTTPK